MGYRHIDNLYKDDRIFSFDECYALEKIHGTSAHVHYKADQTDGSLIFFSGGGISGEILESKDAIRAIGSAAARLFKKRLETQLSQKEKAND